MHSISKGTIDDIDEIGNLQQELLKEHVRYDTIYYALASDSKQQWTNWLRRRITDDDFAIFVAEENSKLAGYVMGWVEKRPPIYEEKEIGYLSNLYVKPAARRSNVGRALVHTLFKWFKQKNLAFTELSVDTLNTGAVKFWKIMGYDPISQRMRRQVD